METTRAEEAVPWSEEKYREWLDYCIEYGKSTWVPFNVLLWEVEGLLGEPTRRERTEGMLRLAGDLFDAGVRPIDLTDGDSSPFIPWNLPKEEALARIRAGLDGLREDIDSIDICWFTHLEETAR
ncbi:hypothetical protein [Nocardiopsis composta]|uniref:Uncharacterized protein n=1 Tax=Nocardiopsis composta TaxID=157465 RepID=A0A7W8QLB4_9ACTN|nr:hypothetical protein [Nocardiopsis composta]MBB5432395.1 hypothetical protein [Nocardiopsis composta]